MSRVWSDEPRVPCLRLWIAALVWAGLGFWISNPAAGSPPQKHYIARVVLIIPNGAQPPRGYKERLRAVAQRTEKYFSDWCDHWGYPLERSRIFQRDASGQIEVTLVKASLKGPAKGRKSIPEMINLAQRHAKAQLNLPKRNANTLWWVFYKYPGMKGFRGGGNANRGNAINAYPEGNAPIPDDIILASKKLGNAKLKAMLHEFGHALGLPHTGPKKGLKLGNSLMGPITPKYHKEWKTTDARVYLNESSAALLWKAPIFQTKAFKASAPTKFSIEDLTCSEDDKGIIHVKGKLVSSVPAHSAVVFDSRTGNYGNYWARSHVAKVEDDGTFDVPIWSPYTEGALFLTLCLNNGFNTADGKQQKTHLKIVYQGKPKQRKFRSARLEQGDGNSDE